MTRKPKLSDLIENYVSANEREVLARQEKMALAEEIGRMLPPVDQGVIRKPIAVLAGHRTLVAYFNGQGDQCRLSYVNDVELIDE